MEAPSNLSTPSGRFQDATRTRPMPATCSVHKLFTKERCQLAPIMKPAVRMYTVFTMRPAHKLLKIDKGRIPSPKVFKPNLLRTHVDQKDAFRSLYAWHYQIASKAHQGDFQCMRSVAATCCRPSHGRFQTVFWNGAGCARHQSSTCQIGVRRMPIFKLEAGKLLKHRSHVLGKRDNCM